MFDGSMWVCIENVEPIPSPDSRRAGSFAAELAATARTQRQLHEPATARYDKTFYAPTLTKAEVRFSIVDEYILLRWTPPRTNMVAVEPRELHRLGSILNDEARRITEH